ncbi:uncharacterized protein PGTG_20123 [Puccinia graminis f. sp. tritici CRL 75-36-700-3]|uniref:Uncharacterized protein n=1 Tax=Puccinia graminis f. sp. tritici (strain CRL 75-36-700-3 / race SCCL) TaxID=418459 RepID=E3NXC4_PUCGT|nr:uncharacterized protein PGTG_20123 [Puccinia graminis f. sp. tritici CRL 75-36-700-3]EFP94223.2 hypothetical protein PGTG_20123 [Puccinia graminis f. sp. tritici CRL 75-36-700-3]
MVSKPTSIRVALNQTISNSTTDSMSVEEFYKIESFISSNAGLELSSTTRIRFWIISTLMVLMGVFYLISLIKNVTMRNYWLIERNRNGYLNPNLEVLVPLFALINSSLVLCSIILMNRDNGRYLSRPTMITQMISYNFLFYCAATRVWRTLSVIPIVPVQLTPRGTSFLSNGLPPSLFNMLVVLLYISFPVATLPITLSMTKDADTLGRDFFILNSNVKLFNAQEEDLLLDDALPPFLANEFKSTLDTLRPMMYQVNRRWRFACGIYLCYCLSLFTLFIYASARLYSTLTVQVQILTQARRRFARMASVGVRSVEDDITSDDASESIQSRTMYGAIVKSIKKLKATIWTQSQDQSELLEFWDCPDSCGENAELERKAKMSSRYRTALLWQSSCSSVIFLSFVVLTACLAFDAFGVPNRTSPTRVATITFEWTGWAWSVPGSVLAFMTCCVALVPHSASEDANNARSAATIRKSSAKGNRLQTELSRTSTESDVVNLRPYGGFLAETPQSSLAKATFTGEIKSLGSRIWRKLCPQWSSSPRSSSSPRVRKLSCFSFSENEKISDQQVVNHFPPGHGIDMQNENASEPVMRHTLQFTSGRDLLPLGQIKSDINIIKSLRHNDP